jgi:hypothetical protein
VQSDRQLLSDAIATFGEAAVSAEERRCGVRVGVCGFVDVEVGVGVGVGIGMGDVAAHEYTQRYGSVPRPRPHVSLHRRTKLQTSGKDEQILELNSRLIGAEREFLLPRYDGLPGRVWYRHVVQVCGVHVGVLWVYCMLHSIVLQCSEPTPHYTITALDQYSRLHYTVLH